jgi:transcriptional regulator with XRE-family HTH domain
MTLSDYLAREEQSIGAFAARLGVSHETVRRYVRGVRAPDLETMRKIARLTRGKVQPNDWLEEDAA